MLFVCADAGDAASSPRAVKAAVATKAREAQTETRCEGKHREDRDQRRDQRKVEQRRERVIPQRQPAVRRLGHTQLAEHPARLARVDIGARRDEPLLA
jgi:hypothetical protein